MRAVIYIRKYVLQQNRIEGSEMLAQDMCSFVTL